MAFCQLGREILCPVTMNVKKGSWFCTTLLCMWCFSLYSSHLTLFSNVVCQGFLYAPIWLWSKQQHVFPEWTLQRKGFWNPFSCLLPCFFFFFFHAAPCLSCAFVSSIQGVCLSRKQGVSGNLNVTRKFQNISEYYQRNLGKFPVSISLEWNPHCVCWTAQVEILQPTHAWIQKVLSDSDEKNWAHSVPEAHRYCSKLAWLIGEKHVL